MSNVNLDYMLRQAQANVNANKNNAAHQAQVQTQAAAAQREQERINAAVAKQNVLPTASQTQAVGTVSLSQRVKQSGVQANTPALPTAPKQNFADLPVQQKLDVLMRSGNQQSALPTKQENPNIFKRAGAILDASAKRGQGNFETLWNSVGSWVDDKLMDVPVVGDWLEEQMRKPENAYLLRSEEAASRRPAAYDIAEQDIALAKQGLGKKGQAAVDLASTISDMGYNIAASAATGIPTRAFNTASSAASAIEQAKADGSTDDEALAYGVLKGGLSYAIDKLSGGIPGFGKGLADDVIAKVSSKIAKNPAGANLVKRAFDVLGEGAEESLETAIDPLLQRLTYDENADFATGEDLLYSAVMGALASAVFNAPGAVADTVNAVKTALPSKNASANAQIETVSNAEANAEQIEAEPMQTEAKTPAQEVAEHMEKLTPDAVPKKMAHTKEWEEAAYQAKKAGERLGVRVEIAEDLPNGVDGEYRNGVIRISSNAADPLKSTFVHELSHHLEATNTYADLRSYVLNRVTNDRSGSDISIDAYRQEIRDAYASKGKTIDDDGIDKEIVAKYIEQNLFNNSKEIAELTNKHRNLGQVIRDWFESLRVKFKGTAKEKELLQAQRLFEKALRETNVKGYRTSGDGQYLVKQTEDGRTAVVVDDDILSNIDTSTWDNTKKDQAKKKAEIALRKFKHGVDVDGIHYVVNKDARDHYSRSNETERLYRTNKDVFADKLRAANNADEILSETSGWANEGLKKKRTDQYIDFRKGKVLIQAGNNQYEATTVVGIKKNGDFVFYDIEDINPASFKTKEEPSSYAVETKSVSAMPEDSSGYTVPHSETPVNGENAITAKNITGGEDDLMRASSGRTADEIKADMKSTVEQYSAMDPHRQPGVREATYPHETAQGKTMRTPQNIAGSNLVDDRMELDIEEAILAGKFAYEVSGDKAALRDVNKRIEDGSYDKLAEQAKGYFADGYRLKKEQVVFVERMIQEASKRGDVDTAMALITDLAAYGTEQGQNIQALSMIRRMTPEGKLMVLKRQVDKANKMTQVDRESKGEIKKAEQEIKAVKKEAFAGLEDIGVDESMDIETAQRVVDEAIADETAKAGQSGLPTAKKQQLQQKKQKLSEAEKKIRELEKAAKNLKNPVTIPTETVEAMLKAKSPSEQNDLYNKALDEIASQIVSSLPDKANAWRYLAMLGNPRTHIRNVTGNATMAAANAAKNLVKYAIESVPGVKRTTVLKSSADAKAFAKEDFELNRDLITGGGKMNASDELRDRMTIFKNKNLEALRKFNTAAMKAEDDFFMRKAYESALARYITANKKTKAFLESGSAAAESFLQKARDYAIREAREVTFHDDSAVADWLSGITRTAKDEKTSTKVAKAMVEGVLPFKKTPINVAKRGVEYSPISVVTALNKFSKGDAAGAVDDLAKGVTGSIMMGIGLALARAGMLRTKNDEKDEVLDTQENEQNYSLRVPNSDGTFTSVSLDALMPAAMPLLVGVEVNKLMQEEGLSVRGFLESLTGIADPIVENSMLDGLNDMLSYVGYSDNAIGAIATDMGESYVEQFRPSILRQIGQTIDPTVRTTYAPKDSPIGKKVETHLRSLGNALPFGAAASEKLDDVTGSDRFSLQPKIDVWGNEVERADSFGARLVQNMVLPFNVKKVTSDPVNEELRRLYRADSTYSVLPKAADKSFAYRNENYYATPAEYTELAKEKGQTAHEYLETTIKDAGYKALPDAKKADVVSNLMKYANYKAKQDFFDGRGINYVTDTFNGVEKAVARGLTAEDYYIMKAQMDGGQTAEEKIPYYMGMLTSEQKKFVARLPKDAASASWLERIALSNQGENAKITSAYDDILIGEKKEKVDYSDKASVYLSLIDGNANSKVGDKYYEYAKPAGVSVEDYMVAYYAQKDVTYPAKTKGAKAAAEAAAIDKALPNLSKKQREALYQAFK